MDVSGLGSAAGPSSSSTFSAAAAAAAATSGAPSASLESTERYEELQFAEKLQSEANNWRLIKAYQQLCNDRYV